MMEILPQKSCHFLQGVCCNRLQSDWRIYVPENQLLALLYLFQW
ncbi:hypothetical protein CCAN11_740003 [Capnocytophaga canimorsus]|uniref:Uncharacterized protein n=1 Tax=Capnocytophaga canimorsus TaxID=28188 RepID=A0A0B7IN32_9FLAO|nr:hypothetical protein CCAN11_740003 [Capnocytophaga canimorsus]